ncbi:MULTISPECIES: aldehyde dehydrogenase family protein [Rhizobium]|uniref:Acyl-CoA reductase-like NAD-dependent aldehyde dehydrogenase n=1 Tax=Rhizobium laguerreae TaxID=1076926 RepID=A0AAX2QBU4_9HYPH|nr:MULTISPECIES: aldehyde dehydrogenase family protein [Rhizobium]TCU12973.1 acyl-CoA reductase-like NAD-dependent aldehyde dehydrogenase [Rhizobium laguerreae]
MLQTQPDSSPRVYGHFIDGVLSDPSQSLIDRRSPADGSLLARFSAGTPKDVDLAVAAAVRALHRKDWAELTGSARAKLLNRFADLLTDDAEHLVRLEAEEASKAVKMSAHELVMVVEMTRFAASLALTAKGEAHTQLGPDVLGLVTKEPCGVVGMIVPWNFPLVCLFQKLPYALAAGCTVVVKPAELTSSTALEIAKLATKAGIPPGVINIVTGKGTVVGEALTSHPDVSLVSFTGSTAVGRRIAGKCGESVKRVALELGGKGANIVFADADLDAALDGVLFGFVFNQGEVCAAGARLIIEESIADEFVSKLAERAKLINVGHPLDGEADMSALIHEEHMNKVLAYVADGETEGAVVVCGGQRLRGQGYDDGCFVGPTILTNVTADMRVFREEIFGPVLCVTRFKSQEEAIHLANLTEYGLANGVWSKDIDKVLSTARKLKSGTVFANTYLEGAVQLPQGGVKQSGFGRENGLDALHEYMETKQTYVKLGARNPILAHTIA